MQTGEIKSIKYKNGNVYGGKIDDNKPHGKGVIKYKNGNVYGGKIDNNKPHGKGVMTNAKGKMIYAGEFQHGKPDGNGLITFADGEWYDGKWQENRMFVDVKKPKKQNETKTVVFQSSKVERVEHDKDVARKEAERNEWRARYRERNELEARDRRWIHSDSSLSNDSRGDYSSQPYVVGNTLSRSSSRMLNDRSSIQNDSADDYSSLLNSISEDDDNAKHNELPKSKDSKLMSTLNSSVKKSHPSYKKLEPNQRNQSTDYNQI